VPTADVNGFSTRWQEGGRGEPVVFVHGGFASFGRTLFDETDYEWGEWEREFASEFRFITYDRRGCQHSSCPATGYEIENQALDLAGLLDQLGVAPIERPGDCAEPGSPFPRSMQSGTFGEPETVNKTVESLENRFGPFRSDEGSNPSPSAKTSETPA
jgi:hypothetical protein